MEHLWMNDYLGDGEEKAQVPPVHHTPLITNVPLDAVEPNDDRNINVLVDLVRLLQKGDKGGQSGNYRPRKSDEKETLKCANHNLRR